MEETEAERKYQSALELEKRGDTNSAQVLFREAALLFEAQAEQRKSYKSFYNAGITFYKLGEWERSMHCLKSCLQVERKFIPAHLLIAQIYQKNGNDDKTETYLLNVIKIDPKHKSALGGLAMFYFERNRYQESMEMLDRYLILYPDNPHLRLLKTQVLAKQGNFKQSATMLKEMVQTESGFISFNQTIEKAWQEENELAQETFRKIKLQAKKKQEEFKAKLSLAEESPETFSPPDPQEALDLSLLYLFNGDPEKAVQYLVFAQKLKDSESTEG